MTDNVLIPLPNFTLPVDLPWRDTFWARSTNSSADACDGRFLAAGASSGIISGEALPWVSAEAGRSRSIRAHPGAPSRRLEACDPGKLQHHDHCPGHRPGVHSRARPPRRCVLAMAVPLRAALRRIDGSVHRGRRLRKRQLRKSETAGSLTIRRQARLEGPATARPVTWPSRGKARFRRAEGRRPR